MQGMAAAPVRNDTERPAPLSVLCPNPCHAQAKTSPLVLNSFAPPLAKVFALRQLHLMQSSKLDAATAFARVEQEMKPQLAALTQ